MDNSNSSNTSLPAPDILANSHGMELLRVWIIDGKPRFIITPNLWDDPSAWGLLLADIINHLGNAYEADGKNKEAVILRINEVFDVEWDNPS